MYLKLSIKSVMALVLLMSSSVYAFAIGKISGKISDQKSGETLIGATVLIQEIKKGASTDVEGRYTLSNIPNGKYTIQIKYIGYKTKSIADVTILDGQITALDAVLEEAGGNALNEVVITDSYKRENVSTLLMKQKTAVAFSNGISQEQIRRSPDRNTSDVLKRVSGASVQDNKFIIVRGLSDRYNTTMLNGMLLPSTEPDKRAFSFDIIPSNMLDNITINKTATPDMPGDFAGGVVQVVTKDIPDENRFRFQLGTNYNTVSTFQTMNMDKRETSEYFGIAPTSRILPSGMPSSYEFGKLNSTQRGVFRSQMQSSPFSFDKIKALPARNLQTSLENRFNLKSGHKIGSILALTYYASDSKLDIERNDYLATKAQRFAYNDQVFKSSANVGLLYNVAWIKDNNKIALKTLYNTSLDHFTNTRKGKDYDQSAGPQQRITYASDMVQRSMLTSQLEGNHQLSWKSVKVDWNLAYSRVDRNQPDLRTLVYTQEEGQSLPVLQMGSSVTKDASRFYSKLQEDNYNGLFNVTYPFTFNGEKGNFKLGGMSQYKSRNFWARTFGYYYDPQSGIPNFELPVQEALNQSTIFIKEDSRSTDKYDAHSNLNAGYGMVDFYAIKKLRVVTGLRYENSTQKIGIFNLQGQKTKEKETPFNDLLPSLNLNYALNEKTNIRGAAYLTVTRPELRELAEFGFWDYISQRTINGNPNLKRSQNANFDLRYEYYPTLGQILSISAYYKIFKNPIEQRVTAKDVLTFQNAEKATNWGIEAEIRKNFDFVDKGSKFWNNLTFFANAAYIFSKVNLNSLTSAVTARALQGQSPYLVNVGLMFNDVDRLLTFSLLYNRAGDRIAEVGYQNYADIYEKGRDVFDFQIAKKILKEKGELRLNISDIFNQYIVFYQDVNHSKSYNSTTDNVMNKYRFGTTLGLTFIYNIGF